MTLPVEPPLEPMLSAAGKGIPRGDGWVYEPKWDGFRALVFRDGDSLRIMSRKGQPLERYFPELVAALKDALPARAVVDGEIVIERPGHGLDFDALQQRIHPAVSRINKLAVEWPTSFVAFDVLAVGHEDVRELALPQRRALLSDILRVDDQIFLTPQTDDPDQAEDWFEQFEGAGLDGIIAKRVEMPYKGGQRVMVKVKHQRTIDCVVGGYRVHKDGVGVGSLLLGLYRDGVLHFVGHTSAFKAAERKELRQTLVPLEEAPEGTFGSGRTPGGPSRWSGPKNMEWVKLRPELVCEVAFEHMQGDRFRHAARILRWRHDKPPAECTWDQLEPPRPFDLADIRKL